jgi:uncharacterized protein with ParB-like and HNH nuclease domain
MTLIPRLESLGPFKHSILRLASAFEQGRYPESLERAAGWGQTFAMLSDSYSEYKKQERSKNTAKFFKLSISIDNFSICRISLPKVYSFIPSTVRTPMYSWGEGERLG